MGKLIGEKYLMENKNFVKLVNDKLEEYNHWCETENMEECKMAFENLYVKEFVYLTQVAEEHFVVYVDDIPEGKVLTIIRKDIYTNKCKLLL